MRRISIIPVVLAAFVLAACGGSSSSSSSSASGGGASSAAATLSEWKVAVAGTVKAGKVTFDVKNAGTFAHNLTVNGPGVANTTTGNIDAGKSGSVTVDLKSGTYELYCSIPGHKAQGMDLKINVS